MVSEYVARVFALKLGPSLLENFGKARNVNPAMDGFIIEAWFFPTLSHCDLKWSIYQGTTLVHYSSEKSEIFFFDSRKNFIGVSLDQPTWMAPIQWNQGGYDAIYIDKSKQLVRFVQVTRGRHHSFVDSPFVSFLRYGSLGVITTVELCFVVPQKNLKNFPLPVSSQDFKNNVVTTAFAKP